MLDSAYQREKFLPPTRCQDQKGKKNVKEKIRKGEK